MWSDWVTVPVERAHRGERQDAGKRGGHREIGSQSLCPNKGGPACDLSLWQFLRQAAGSHGPRWGRAEGTFACRNAGICVRCVRMRACVRAWAAKASRSGPRRPRRRWLSHVDGLPAKHQSTCPFPRAAAELTESRSGQPDKRSPLHPEVPRRARGHVQVRP